VNVALPLHHRLIDWIPDWHAGCPEIQFHQPESVFVGWLFTTVTSVGLSETWIYELAIFFSYTMPVFAFYYTLRRLGLARIVLVPATNHSIQSRCEDGFVEQTGIFISGLCAAIPLGLMVRAMAKAIRVRQNKPATQGRPQ
jgi:hypothetical protein